MLRELDEALGSQSLLELRDLICPTPGVLATADAAQGDNHLNYAQFQANLRSSDSPLWECRIIRVLWPLQPDKLPEKG